MYRAGPNSTYTENDVLKVLVMGLVPHEASGLMFDPLKCKQFFGVAHAGKSLSLPNSCE
jgi:hypothetical protein